MDKVIMELSDWLKGFVRETFNKLVKIAEKDNWDKYGELMKKSEVCEVLNINSNTFDDHYRTLEGFPKELPATRWSKASLKIWLTKQI